MAIARFQEIAAVTQGGMVINVNTPFVGKSAEDQNTYMPTHPILLGCTHFYTPVVMLWCYPSVHPSVVIVSSPDFFCHLCSYRIDTWVIVLY
jgi:hypothetical protein